MADYDFGSLSGYDFALLARDLLQADLGIHLESFSQGPDSGIDFRFRRGRTNLIVQCKHYSQSGYSALTSILRRKERLKIDALKPSRYILATSVALSPPRKDEIKEILGPTCLNTADIYGRDDLNNLLGQHTEVERRHFKLWLTSETVLRRVLDAGIFADAEAHLERVRQRLRRYVQNPSFDRARALLDKAHYCIIAGIPGIGKTTLAEVLLADLVDRQGFEAVRIAHDLAEIRPVKNSKRKQAFYFDDFLGKTALEKLQKNEDQRLVELMEEAAANANWRFILTTREYILNAARLSYETFAHPPVDLTLCVINLADYARPIRANILYNHIYFSDLPTGYKIALLQNRGYETIVKHRNYNPRVIEYMTQSRHARVVAPSLYLSEFADSLEHPTRIWDHAFRHQVSEAPRHLLLVLGTLPDDVLLADLEEAFWTFYRFRQGKFGFSTSSGDWTDALKELDGSFIATRLVGSDMVVSFHGPSIRDFIEDFLSSSEGDVGDLIAGAHFYEQYRMLWTGRRSQRYKGVDRHRDAFLGRFRTNIFGPSASTIRVVDSDGAAVGLHHRRISNESRVEFAVRVVNDLQTDAANQFLEGLVRALEKLWIKGDADKDDLVRLLTELSSRGLRHEDAAFLAAKQCISTGVEEIGEFRAIADFSSSYPTALSPAELKTVKDRFLEVVAEYSPDWNDNPDWLEQVVADMEYVAEKLAVKVDPFIQKLQTRIGEIESERAGPESQESEDREWQPSSAHQDDTDQMFQSLREELEG